MSTYRIDGIKYNPANWAGLAPSERAACNRFAAARERELNTITATPHTCNGGPFAGSVIELESTTDRTAPMAVGGWVGHYELQYGGANMPEWQRRQQAGISDNVKTLRWVGNDAGAAVNTHGAATSNKAAPEITGKGFDQLRDLLAEMAEDPTEREEVTTSSAWADCKPGHVDDFGDEYTPRPRGAWAVYPVATVGRSKKKAYQVASDHQNGRNTPDDFGALVGITDRPAYRAEWLRIVRRARYTIGRTTYTVTATAAAVDKLRARLIKIKKWLSDKMLTAAGPGRTTEAIPDIAAAMAATLAIAQAQASAATAHQGDTAEACGELVTCDGPDGADTAEATPCADTPADVAQAIAEAHTSGADEPDHCTDPLKTLAQARGYPDPLKTQADHQAARASVDQRHAEQASATHGVGGGEGRPFENEINPSAFLGDIPLSLAVQAHSGTSFSPEKRGARVQKEHADTMAADYKEMHAQAVRGGTLDLLPEVFARYRARQAGAMRAYLASSSRIVSSFIAGPSNFPAARMNKRADIAHRRLTEYLDGGEMAKRAAIRTLRPDLRAIMAGDADAVDRLTVKINAAERSQAKMKAANKAIRQHAKEGESAQVEALMSLGFTEEQSIELVRPSQHWRGVGFAAYSLSNNNANIRRMRDRMEQITKAQARPVVEIEGADGIRLEDDAPANRVRLFFPGKPAAEIRDALKARGFRWAPSVGAWQAYRNTWALNTAQEMAGNLSEAEPVEVQQAAQEMAPEIPAEIAPDTAQAAPIEAPAPTPCATMGKSTSDAPALPEVATEPIDNTPPTNPSGFAQQARSKMGAWCAALYRDPQGAHVLRFDALGLPTTWASHASRAELMASLQAMARQADQAQAAAATQASAEAHTPADPAPAAPEAYTPSADAPSHYTDPLKTQDQAPDYTAPLKTQRQGSALEQAPAVVGFERAKPFSLDPRELLSAGLKVDQLVGLGVLYLGNAANASGEGAITEATDSRGQSFGGLNMVCTLEDGRVIKADPHSFTGELRPIFQFNGKMHGTPYLAQLAAVRASLKAQHSSAHAVAQTEHARQLETLAAEFPQLERKGKNSAGKLAAINMRKLLKQAFKAVKFSVTSDYNSARVGWEDGPTVEQVNAAIGRFDIGRSDSQSDYFYTVDTAWSDLFGGVQYLFTNRSTSDALVSKAIAQAFASSSAPEDATPANWRKAEGAFSWNTDAGQFNSRRVREILSKTPG